jgi:hypothetical protein
LFWPALLLLIKLYLVHFNLRESIEHFRPTTLSGPALMMTVMTYGADIGGMLGCLAALVTLCLSLRRPRGKHRKRHGRQRASDLPGSQA